MRTRKTDELLRRPSYAADQARARRRQRPARLHGASSFARRLGLSARHPLRRMRSLDYILVALVALGIAIIVLLVILDPSG